MYALKLKDIAIAFSIAIIAVAIVMLAVRPVTEESEEEEDHNTAKKSVRKPGKQLGGKGFGRKNPLKAEIIVPHYPSLCSACNENL